MAEKYKVEKYTAFNDGVWMVVKASGKFRGAQVACFWMTDIGTCPNAEREARNLCRRLNAAAKKGKGKR